MYVCVGSWQFGNGVSTVVLHNIFGEQRWNEFAGINLFIVVESLHLYGLDPFGETLYAAPFSLSLVLASPLF